MAKYVGWGQSELANGLFPAVGKPKKDWAELHERLKSLLTDRERKEASRTTQYAHYTSPEVIRNIYDGLGRLGMVKAVVMEPGMGAGNFLGLMPGEMAKQSHYTGIEFDSLTAKIAKYLYPDSSIHHADFTRFDVAPDSYDLVIGNPPFASTAIKSDQKYKKHGFSLHEYFFAKSIDSTRPGGLLVFVTSRYLMDKKGGRARQYLQDRADLLGAIRLPQTAFKANAGTEVVTDILFLRKRELGAAPLEQAQAWSKLVEISTPEGPAVVNEYFAAHPEMVLGEHSLQGSMYGKNEYTVLPSKTGIEAELARAVARLPEGVYRSGETVAQRVDAQAEAEFVPDHKQGAFYHNKLGRLMQVGPGKMAKPVLARKKGVKGGLFKTHIALINELVPLKEKTLEVLNAQVNGQPFEKLQQELNVLYDAFVEKHGPVNKRVFRERKHPKTGKITETELFPNKPNAIKADPDMTILVSLDEHDPVTGKSTKNPILTGTVLAPEKPPVIETAPDALAATLNEKGFVDMADIAAKLGMNEQDAAESLGDLVYFDPVGEVWETADEYLSGRVRSKLKEAQAAAKSDPAYQRNVKALEEVQPRDILPSQITARMGASWVPSEDVALFAQEELGLDASVNYSPVGHFWSVDRVVEVGGDKVGRYGTNRVSAKELLKATLNQEQINVYDTVREDGKNKRVLNSEQTELARARQSDMKQAFERWIWSDGQRAERLARTYNQKYNDIVPRRFDGRHLTLPGITTRIELRPHQKRVVWRVLQSGNTYMAHTVGAGKTMAAVAAGMEQKRLGLIKKPMYVVPNHMLNQFSREYLELYPAAKILVADEEAFHGKVRHEFVARAAGEPWDAVIMTHSSFGLIKAPQDFERRMLEDELERFREALENVPEDERATRKRMEKMIEQKEQRLEEVTTRKQDQGIAFEQLGVDFLFVDEAHEFRKLSYATSQGNVKGIDPNGSQRAWDLYVKSQYLESRTPGRSLALMSGTPVTNTMGEMFTLQRYLQGDLLNQKGLDHFDAWSGQFADTVSVTEQAPNGGYKVVTRLAKFVNVPELLRMFRDVADVVRGDDLDGYVQRPVVRGGGMDLVTVEATPLMTGFQKSLGERMKAIEARKGPPKKGDDILLTVITDGRHAAIDDRYIDEHAPEDNDSKLNEMLDRVYRIWEETKDTVYFDRETGEAEPITGATQMVFADLGVSETRGFSAYEWMKEYLVKRGVPAREIAYIRDHKKAASKLKLFADLNSGRRRILIGSSRAMGTGVNAQQRLIALHHLDAPWYPADMEQRRGRMVRQGNKNKEVREYGYATKGTYDSTMFTMLETKQRFIDQMWSDDFSVREMEDVAGEADNYAIAKALSSGDERLIQKVGLEQDVARLERLRNAHVDEQYNAKWRKADAQARIESRKEMIQQAEKQLPQRVPTAGKKFSAKIGGQSFTDRKKAGAALIKAIDAAHHEADPKASDFIAGKLAGFDIQVFISERGIKSNGRPGERRHAPDVALDLVGVGSVPVSQDASPLGLMQKLENQAAKIEQRIERWQEDIDAAQVQIDKANAVLGSKFDREQEFQEKLEQLNQLEAEIAADTVDESESDGEARFSRSAMKSVSVNIRRGKEALAKAVADKTTVHRAMYRNGLGWVDFVWGDEGRRLSASGKRKGAKGLAHILEARMRKEGYSDQEAMRFLGDMVAAIAKGEEVSRTEVQDSVVVRIKQDGNLVYLTKKPGSNGWVITAYKENPGGAGAGYDAPAPTHPESTHTRNRMGAGNVSIGENSESGNSPFSEVKLNAVIERVAPVLKHADAVVVVDSFDALPAAAKKDAEQQGAGKHDVEGVFHKGKIYLVRDMIAMEEQAERLLFHEASHSGLQAMLGDRGVKVALNKLYLSLGGPRGFNRLADKFGVDLTSYRQGVVGKTRDGIPRYDDETRNAILVDELIAHIAEQGSRTLKAKVLEVLGAIRNWLRTHGFMELAKYNAADIAALARSAREYGLESRGNDGGTRFSRSSGEKSSLDGSLPIDKAFSGKWASVAKEQSWGLLTLRQIAEVLKAQVPKLAERYLPIFTQYETDQNVLKARAGEIAQARQKLKRSVNEALARLQHEATIAGVDPAESYSPLIDDKPAAIKKIQVLKRRIKDASGTYGSRNAKLMREIEQIKADLAADKRREAGYDGLVAQWRALPKAAREIYLRERDHHRDVYRMMKEALIQRIADMEANDGFKKAMMDKLRVEFERESRMAPYFPLARFGRYWVSSVDARGEAYFDMFESLADQQRFIRENRGRLEILGSGKQLDGLAEVKGVNAKFISGVDELLQGLGDGPEVQDLRDEVYQLYLQSLPELSARKHFLHRKKTKGFSEDQARAFADKALHDANHIARLRHLHRMERVIEDAEQALDVASNTALRGGMESQDHALEAIANSADAMSFSELREAVKAVNDDNPSRRVEVDFRDKGPILDAIEARIQKNSRMLEDARHIEKVEFVSNGLSELKKSHQALSNPNTHPVAQKLNSLGFAWFLGLTPAAALVNLTQTPVVALPLIGVRYGMARVSRHLTRASKDFMAGGFSVKKALSKEEREAFDYWEASGLLTDTLAHDLAGVADAGINTGTFRLKMMTALSFMFHHAERMNREVTALAAYRAARENGVSHQKAMEDAASLTYKSHFDYSAGNRARFMRGNFARVVTQFKQYSQNISYLYARILRDVFRGESREVRYEARKALIGMVVGQFLVAGSLGMPLAGVLMAAAQGMEDAFGDDDDPVDVKAEFRQWLADSGLGEHGGRFVAKGFFDAFTPYSLSGRLSLSDLWIRTSDRDLEGRAEAQEYINALLGPQAAIFTNLFVAKDLMLDGKEDRAIEYMTPKFVKDAFRAVRFVREDARSMRGYKLKDMELAEAIGQMMGFSPAQLAELYEVNTAIRNVENKRNARRRALIDAVVIARQDKDAKAAQAAWRAIRAWNKKHPDDQITPKTVKRSIRGRSSYAESLRHGVRKTRRNADLIERYQYAGQ